MPQSHEMAHLGYNRTRACCACIRSGMGVGGLLFNFSSLILLPGGMA